MKNNLNRAGFPYGKMLFIFIMRTFIFLFCATLFALTPVDVVSQNSKIVIEKDRILSVDQVFDLIMEQTEYRFFYEEGIFKGLSQSTSAKRRNKNEQAVKGKSVPRATLILPLLQTMPYS